VNHEENIKRMVVEGLISERQADLLKSAVQGVAVAPSAAAASPKQWLLPMLIIMLLVILGFMFFSTSPEPETIQNVSQTLNQTGSTGHMNRQLSAILGIAILFIIPLIMVVWLYNSIVGKEEKTMESWSQVEASYQRRADLIPILIETVAKYVKHEQSTLDQVTEARANPDIEVEALLQAQNQAIALLQAQQGKVPTDEAVLADLTKVQAIIGKSAGKLMAVAESYPQLRASDQFLELQAQFEGTENRILTARVRFNEAVEAYNSAIRKMPGSLIAGFGQFQRKAYFKADVASAQTPERKWD